MGRDVARRLRKRPTEAEQRLWSRLRRQQLDGFRFRRQAPIGRYVVDFVCFSTSLVIEVHGGEHAFQRGRDERRTRWLESQGFHVLRLWNNEVLGNTEGVLEVILAVLRERETEKSDS